MAEEHPEGGIRQEQTIQEQPPGEAYEYYQERYDNVRLSLPETTYGKLFSGVFALSSLAIMGQYFVPSGVPPNSIEPWIGPLPFSWAYFLFWMIVLQVTMIGAYYKLVSGGEE